VSCIAKGYVLQRKRHPFTRQKATFRGLSALIPLHIPVHSALKALMPRHLSLHTLFFIFSAFGRFLAEKCVTEALFQINV